MSRQTAASVAQAWRPQSVLKDPPCLYRLAEMYGRWIVNGTSGDDHMNQVTFALEGEMTWDLAEYFLCCACENHPAVGPDRRDEVMLRLMPAMERVAYADELAAAQEIRLGIQPLLNRRAKTAAIQAEAYRLSAARLLRPDCDAIVRDEIAKRLAAAPNRAYAR